MKKTTKKGLALLQVLVMTVLLVGCTTPPPVEEQKSDVLILQKKAEQGDADAQYGLGLLYYNGLGVEQDYTKAAEWYRKAAEQGHTHAKEALEQLQN